MQDIVEPPIKDYGVEISDKESEENDSNRLNNEQRVDLPVKQSEEYCLEGKADSRLIISNIQDNCLEIEHDYADDQNERLSMQDEQNDEDQNLIATNIENILIEVEAEELQGENLDKNRAENFEDNFPSCSIKIEKEEIQETFIAQKYLIHDSQIAVLEPYDSKEDEGCNFKSDSERTLMTFNGFNVRVEENFKNINLKPRVVMKAVGRFIYECSNCSYNTSKRDLIINHNMSKHPKKITLKKKKSLFT